MSSSSTVNQPEPGYTPWFDGDHQHPVRVGKYEVRHNPEIPCHIQRVKLVGSFFRWWSGSRWTIYEGSAIPSMFGQHASHQWRGLSKNPEPFDELLARGDEVRG